MKQKPRQKRKKSEAEDEDDSNEMPMWKDVISSKDAVIASQQNELKRALAMKDGALAMKDGALAMKDEALAMKDEALAMKNKALELAEDALAREREHASARISALKAEVLVAKGLLEARFVIDIFFFVLELENCS